MQGGRGGGATSRRSGAGFCPLGGRGMGERLAPGLSSRSRPKASLWPLGRGSVQAGGSVTTNLGNWIPASAIFGADQVDVI